MSHTERGLNASAGCIIPSNLSDDYRSMESIVSDNQQDL